LPRTPGKEGLRPQGITERLIANQFHRNLTSAGFSASSVEKYL